MPCHRQRLASLAAVVVLAVAVRIPAQEPAGDAMRVAPGKVSEIQGAVLAIHGKVLDIVGVSLGIEGTLKELGATVTAQEIRIELAADVLFDLDKAELRPDALGALRKLAGVIASTSGPVMIVGHTDGKGEDAYNQKLSERRAASVKAWLAEKGGIDAARISTRGLGETKPKVPNVEPDGSDNPAGRQQNRRVEITIKKQA